MANEKEWQQDISTTVDTHTTTIADHEERITANKVKLDEHETRIDNIETTTDIGKITLRVNAIEQKNTEQDSRLDNIDTLNEEQNSKIKAIQDKDNEQDAKIVDLEKKSKIHDESINTINSINSEQNARLTSLETKDSEQDSVIDTLKSSLITDVAKNFGNDYYDDSDITSLIYAGNGEGTIRNEIANGNFARVHPGQTIKGKVTGTTYIVVGCNIYLHRGDTQLTRNHIGLMPILLVGNTGNLLWSGRTYAGSGVNNTTQGYAPWASDNNTEGKNQTSCYKDSYIANTVLPKVDNLWLKPDFENQGISVLTFRNLDAMKFDANAVCMSNPNWKGCAVEWWLDSSTNGWTSKRLVLPSEPEIYGHYAWAGSSFESGSQHTQLPLYRHRSIHEIIYADIWLKDSASASRACRVGADGYADYDGASDALRVCPLFLIA